MSKQKTKKAKQDQRFVNVFYIVYNTSIYLQKEGRGSACTLSESCDWTKEERMINDNCSDGQAKGRGLRKSRQLIGLGGHRKEGL